MEGEKESGNDGRGESGERKEEGGGKDGEERKRERARSWKHLPKAASVFCVLFHSVASLRGMN